MTQKPLSAHSVIRRSDQALFTDLGDEIILMDVRTGVYSNLKATAGEIWRRIEAPTSVQTLLGALGAEYDVTPETAEADVMAFLNVLHQRDMIVVDAA